MHPLLCAVATCCEEILTNAQGCRVQQVLHLWENSSSAIRMAMMAAPQIRHAPKTQRNRQQCFGMHWAGLVPAARAELTIKSHVDNNGKALKMTETTPPLVSTVTGHSFQAMHR